jgi:predicted CXXCH cytochrome family protein
MQVEVTFLTRRGPDAIMRKSQTVTAESIRFGRGTDNEVPLPDNEVPFPDIRVGLHAAALTQREAGLVVEQTGDMPVRVNGAIAATATVGAGDKIIIGPYEVVIVEPPQGLDAAVTVELVHAMGDALERILAHSRLSLAQAGLSRRRWSWALFLLVAICGLAAPLALFPLGKPVTSSRMVPGFTTLDYVNMTWNSGEVSNPHRFFAQDCASCHRGAFTSVPDSACVTCHAGIGSHLAANVDFGPSRHEIETTRCGACHQEHRGIRSLAIRWEALCVRCHAGLAETAPKADLRDVGGYPSGHPQFRATVVADAAKPSFARELVGGEPKPQDHPNLVFSHSAHLIETGFLTPAGHKVMVCADCHVPDTGGQGFQPITFEAKCHSCHDLKFDTALPWREVPHGDAAGVKNAVEDFYARTALEGGVQDADAPAFVRRAVGTPTQAPSETERSSALAWAADRANVAMGIIFDDKRGCTYCHVTNRANGAFTVAPVLLLNNFLPGARFDHSKHTALGCADCHDARHSEKSSDVLLPGIQTCVTCHGDERAKLSIQSSCTSCHLFHRPEFGPMKTANAGQ